MNIPNDFKKLARNIKFNRHNQALPKLRTSLSPLQSAKNSPLSSSPKQVNSKRSMSTDKLPGLKHSNSGTKSIGSNFGSGRTSARSCGVVKAYAVNSYPGKHHHQDRVSIIMNFQSPSTVSEENWPKSSYFALFDGHCGKGCAEYLKSNLSQLIFKNSNFPFSTKKAISAAFSQADQEFMQYAKNEGDMSGSSAILTLIIGNKCFVAGTGDSRAIISVSKGKSVIVLNDEHRPSVSKEYDRVIRAGGKVYNEYIINEKGEEEALGPLYINPGKLRVSRALGDVDAKDPEFGGNPEVILCEPDIKSFKIKPDQNFILLGSAPVFERFSNREIVEVVLRHLDNGNESVTTQLQSAIEEIFAECVSRGCNENMTILVIALKSVKKTEKPE